MAVRYVRVPSGTGFGPVLQGLPRGRCPSDRWGLVLEGSPHLIHADGSSEQMPAGAADHRPAGHTASTDEGNAFIEVIRDEDLQQADPTSRARPLPAGPCCTARPRIS